MTFRRAGVVGCPVHHSKSPLIHNYWLQKYNINAVYDAFEIKPEELPAFIAGLVENGFAGINVTVPHKVGVMSLMNE